jgi:hypothetical protein
MNPSRFVIPCLLAMPFVGGVACGSASSGGPAAGAAGSASGNGGASAGAAGSTSGFGGASAGAPGATSGNGGASAGAPGAASGSGGASAGAAGAASGDGGASAGAGGAHWCGNTTCGSTQYCVIPCCGGAAQPCFPAPDGGMCPSGSHLGCYGAQSYVCTSPAACCQPAPCDAPLPYCSNTIPTGCLTEQARTCRFTCA